MTTMRASRALAVPMLLALFLLMLAGASPAHADSIVWREVQSLDPVSRDVSVTIDFATPFDPAAGQTLNYYFGLRDFPLLLTLWDLRIGTEDPDAGPGQLAVRYGTAYLERGQLAGTIPFVLSPDGFTLSFTVPGSYMGPPVFLPARATYRLVVFDDGVPIYASGRGSWGFGPIVPEPGSGVLAMVGVGIVGAEAVAMRRRKSAG